MSFVLRAALILLVFAFVVYVLKALRQLNYDLRRTKKEMRQPGAGRAGRAAADTPMLRCAACGAFVAAREAVQISARGKSRNFCSTACLQKLVKSA